MDLSIETALALLEELPEGIALVDARQGTLPVVLANRSFAALLGRTGGQLAGVPLAELLPAGERDRAGELAALLARGEAVTWRVAGGPSGAVGGAPAPAGGLTELQFRPLRSAGGELTHYFAVHRPGTPPVAAVAAVAAVAEAVDVTEAVEVAEVAGAAAPAATETRPLPREDRLTGLAHAEYFHELYQRDFSIAQREGRSLTIFLVDMDGLETYNTTFGRQSGDSALRRVGRAVMSGMRRASDLIARLEGGRFIGLSAGLTAEQARRHGETLAARVRELHMHHPRSPVARFVTVSVGVAQCVPTPQSTPDALLQAAQQALTEARAAGRNRVALRSLGGGAGPGAAPG